MKPVPFSYLDVMKRSGDVWVVEEGYLGLAFFGVPGTFSNTGEYFGEESLRDLNAAVAFLKRRAGLESVQLVGDWTILTPEQAGEWASQKKIVASNTSFDRTFRAGSKVPSDFMVWVIWQHELRAGPTW